MPAFAKLIFMSGLVFGVQNVITESTGAEFLNQSRGYQLGYVDSFVHRTFSSASDFNAKQKNHFATCITSGGLTKGQFLDVTIQAIRREPKLLVQPASSAIWQGFFDICGAPK